MTDVFQRREDAFEIKFARDNDHAFRLRARRDRLFGDWVAKQLGLTGDAAAAYAARMAQMAATRPNDGDVVDAALADLHAAGVAPPREDLAARFNACADQAAADLSR